MKVTSEPDVFQRACERARGDGHIIGFVPTMGALHEGHRALMRAVRAEGADYVAVSIFVNPLQFGPNEDLAAYPRTLEADLIACEEEGIELILAPQAGGLVSQDAPFVVRCADEAAASFEGRFRPNHFDGVATILTKLFNLSGRCIAAFGRKDLQQLVVVKQLIADLHAPVSLCEVETIRDKDGLALSSRNKRLHAEERQRAVALPRTLREAQRALGRDKSDVASVLEGALTQLTKAFDEVDYVDVVDTTTFQPVRSLPLDCRARLIGAVRLGDVRLIDNLPLTLTSEDASSV